MIQLIGQLPIAGDGALGELGEEKAEGGEAGRIGFGAVCPAIDVRQVGHEGEEIVAQAQHTDVQQLEGHKGHCVDRHRHSHDDSGPGCALDADAKQEVGPGEDQRPEGGRPGSEGQIDHAARQQHIPFCQRRNETVDHQKNGHKDEKLNTEDVAHAKATSLFLVIFSKFRLIIPL